MVPQGLQPRIFFGHLAARLKPCPFKTCAAPTGLGASIVSNPTLKRGANKLCASGAHAVPRHATITSVPWATRELHRSGRKPAASAGKIRTRFTPLRRASRQALSLGNMPPEMTAFLAISAI